MAKLSKTVLKRRGQLAWYHQLLKAGRTEEAIEWHHACRLGIAPLSHPLMRADLPGIGNVSEQAPQAASAAGPVETGSSTVVSASAPTVQLLASPVGGAGVSVPGLAKNLDHTPLGVENSQLEQAGDRTPDGSGSAGLASPSGEVEGNKQSCQGDKGGLFSNRLENGGWLVGGEGVVGGNCRNRWYVEVSVGGQWAKAAVGDVQVRRGQRVRVRLSWVSADGRDAEYDIVEVLPDLAEPVQARPVGFEGQSARPAVVAKVEPAKPVKMNFETLAPQSSGLFQTGVQTVHEQPKEIVFQTTTMEQVVARERVGVMHASGKTGPMPAAEEFRSPVLDDVPAQPVDDASFLDRAREQGYRELMGLPPA